MSLDCRHVFVYGTLRQGFSNPGRAILRQHARFVDDARTEGALHDLGAYPALCLPEGEPDAVQGEVYELVDEPEQGLAKLDRYEGARGADPLPYERRRRTIELADGGSVDAWLYVWTESPPDGSRIEGGDWVEHVKSRSRDSF